MVIKTAVISISNAQTLIKQQQIFNFRIVTKYTQFGDQAPHSGTIYNIQKWDGSWTLEKSNVQPIQKGKRDEPTTFNKSDANTHKDHSLKIPNSEKDKTTSLWSSITPPGERKEKLSYLTVLVINYIYLVC